jgi:UDP-2,4-diacetamido-2,4,6-trideoxy-beta-L-altropyranose hydrolase
MIINKLANMLIFFRVDSSSKIGTGHVMRCLSLANLLKLQGHTIKFMCSNFQNNINRIIKQNFEVYTIEKKAEYDGFDIENQFDWEDDVFWCKNIIKDSLVHLLIVDHYKLDVNWEKAMMKNVGYILVIDDLYNRSHYCCLLVNQNITSDKSYEKLVNVDCKLLLGPTYALINSKFNKKKIHDGKIKIIHICFGGSDINNVTGKVVKCIIQNRKYICNFNKLVFDVVVGASNPNLKYIKKQIAGYKNFNLYHNVDNMDELLYNSDMCIGAGGISVYERCIVGIPTILISIADNQKTIAIDLDKIGVCSYIGESICKNLVDMLNSYLDESELVIKQSVKCKEIVDGLGLSRILLEIEELFMI